MKEVAVLGSGAAGLTAAYFAAVTQKSKKNFVNTKVTVYEKTKESGKKILMSGGARCNVLPVEASISDYVTDSNPRLAKAILQSWTIPNCLYWLQDEVQIELGIEHTTNKYFPLSNSSREVRDKLVEACKREGVVFQYETNVKRITKNEANDTWVVNTEDGKDIEADVLVLLIEPGTRRPSTTTWAPFWMCRPLMVIEVAPSRRTGNFCRPRCG